MADAVPDGKILSFDPMSASQKTKALGCMCFLSLLCIILAIATITQYQLKSVENLSNFSSEQHDWNSFIFSSVYTVDADKGCSLYDEPILKVVYPGVQETCYAQVIGFDEARD